MSISRIGHQSQTMYPDGSCKNGGARQGYKLLFGETPVRQREGTKIVSPGLYSLRASP